MQNLLTWLTTAIEFVVLGYLAIGFVVYWLNRSQTSSQPLSAAPNQATPRSITAPDPSTKLLVEPITESVVESRLESAIESGTEIVEEFEGESAGSGATSATQEFSPVISSGSEEPAVYPSTSEVAASQVVSEVASNEAVSDSTASEETSEFSQVAPDSAHAALPHREQPMVQDPWESEEELPLTLAAPQPPTSPHVIVSDHRQLAEEQPDRLAEQLLELALRSGAEAAEVFQSRSLARPVFFEANRLKQLESAQAEGMALRLWHEGRPGLAVAYGPVDPQTLVDRAIALSQLNDPETIELAEASRAFYPDLGESVAVEQLVDWGRQSIALVRQAYPEVLCTAEWECEAETVRLINSNGLDCGYTDTTLSCYLSAEWVRGDDFLSVSDGQTQRGSLDPARLVQQILQRLDWAQENVAPPIGRVPILFTSKAADMLWGTVQAALNGKQVIEGASPWSDRLNEPVISDSITLSQQPNSGPFSCPFDDEGTPTRPITFIENGVLKLFYTDRTTGRALGSGTTGNGFRPGLGSYPTPGLFNCLVEPSSHVRPGTSKSLTELIATMDDGLIVDQMLGGGAGISGEFSVNVDLGYRVKHGQVIGRVKDTMVSGNVYTALKHILELGNDADWNGSCYTPSLIVDRLSVTGRS